MKSRLENLVTAQVRKMQPYSTPARGDLIKLDAMENPYPLPREIKTKWRNILQGIELNRYPDADCEKLKRAIVAKFKPPRTSKLVLGNGSDELIQMLIALVARGRVVMAPTPCFSMYQQIAIAYQAKFVGVPLRDDFTLNAQKMLAAIRRHRPPCIFLASPNNPSGNCFARNAVLEIIARAPGLVVIDEAYFPFSGRSFCNDIIKFPNLLVLRTLSKSGLAALRLGFLIAPPKWATQLEKMRLPYNINSLTQASGEFFLTNYATLKKQTQCIIAQREKLFLQLNKLPNIHTYPSAANFILARLNRNPNKIFNQLKTRGILVKNLHCKDAALKNCLRITVGTPAENKKLISALKEIL